MKRQIFLKFFFCIAIFCKLSFGQNVTQEWIVFPEPQSPSLLRIAENQILVDDSGNVYTGGVFWDSISGSDILGVAKINSAGTIQWYNSEDGLGYSYGVMGTIAIDSNYNLFVTGTTDYSTTFEAGRTNKYDLNGTLVWSHPLDSPATYGTIGHGNYISSQNECYDLIRNQNITIRKFDTSGNVILQFSNDTVDAAQNHGFLINGFKMDRFDNIYVYGTYVDTPNLFERKYFVKKFSPSGAFKWEVFYNPTSGSDNPTDMFIDSLQNVYLNGRVNVNQFYGTVVYDSAGNEKWHATFQNGGSLYADDVIADNAGNCYATGISFLVKYDTSGNIIWQRSLDSARASSFAKIKLDEASNVYVTYAARDTIVFTDYVVTAKFDSSGNLKWKVYYNAPPRVTALTIDKFNNVYIAGEGFVIKYSQLTGIDEFKNEKDHLLIYPNPSDNYIKINCSICQAKIKIDIVNPLGQLILSKNDFNNYDIIDISQFSKGVYFLKVYSEHTIYSQKFIRE